MTQSLEQTADRITVCGLDNINQLAQKPNIGLIITAVDRERLKEYLDLATPNAQGTQFHFMAIHNVSARLEAVDERDFSYNAVQKDLLLLENFLNQNPNKKIIINCAAGKVRSPLFTLMVLLHLQGEDTDIDKALATLHKIKPDCNIGVGLHVYEDYLGNKYNTYLKAIEDYSAAKALTKCRNKTDVDGCLSHCFNERAPKTLKAITQFCARFGMKPTALKL